MNIQTCKSFLESVPLYLPQDLFLKPLARLKVSIQLPSSKAMGKTISNWELMERMRDIIQPETFSSLKVVKTSSESIRFEGEIEDKRNLGKVINSLDGRSVKLNGYPEFLKLKASEAKLDFPTRHTWDSFFRDASNMDEMKHGERPDTVHIANLPIKWFVSPRDVSDDDAKPSENIFKKVFERFGKIRCIDIPICDPYRKQMKPHMTGISTFSFDSELYFEGYVQFSEYVGFVRAMDAFRGMKVVKKMPDGTGQTVTVQVDFDRTKHLSDASIKRRSIVRERLVGQERAKEEKEKEESLKQQKKEEAERRKQAQSEMDKLSHTQEREERRKAKQLAKLKEKESKEINSKIAEEQKKLVKTQRKLQSIRLVEELFRRIQLKHKPAIDHKREDPYNIQNRRDKDNKKELKKIEKALLLENKEKWVREKLVKKYKSAQEQELEEQRHKLKKALEGNIVLRSALDTGKKRERTPSISSLSSGSDICLDDFPDKKIKTERITSPERHPYIKKEGDLMMPGYSGQVPQYNYAPYPPYINPSYNYPHQMGNYFPRSGYYPQGSHQDQAGPLPYNARGRGGFISRRGRGGVYNANHIQHPHRGGYRGGPRMPFFDGPNANHAYYKYFKKLAEGQTGDYLDRERSYSRSRSRSRRRSYSRSRSRSSSRSRSRRRSSSRRRSRYSRSRSGHSRSRSRNRRTRTRSRSRSRSRRSRSRSRDRSKSRSKSRRRRSHSKRTQSRERSPHVESKKSTDFIPRAVRENADRSKANDKDRHSSEDKNLKVSESGEGEVQKSHDPANDKRESPKSWSPQGHDGRKRDTWSESPTSKK